MGLDRRSGLASSLRNRRPAPFIASDALTVRFGLHWGGPQYVGNIATPARSEVTARGDEVNETARIEPCASGGLILASKQLLERLDPPDAAAIGLGLQHLSYTPLGELPTATAKALRDAA